MSKLLRYTQKVFGSTAASNQISKFGSLSAGSPVRYSGSTATPALTQALNNFLDGWLAAVEGVNSPAIEDMNSLFFTAFYQLAYLFQQGVAEYDSGTTYYEGSMAMSAGLIYVSLTDNNTGNALTNGTYWNAYNSLVNIIVSNTTLSSIRTVNLTNTASGDITVFLPLVSSVVVGTRFIIKDIGTGVNATTVRATSPDTIDGNLIYPTLLFQYDSLTVVSSGTAWFVI